MGQTALQTKSLCFNMGKRRHPLFGSSRDFFIQISSPAYAANRIESSSSTGYKSAHRGSNSTRNKNPYALTWENDVIHYSVPVATFSSRFRVQRIVGRLTYAANRTESIGANRMLIGPPWVKRHSKPNPYASTWENDVIHYSFPVPTICVQVSSPTYAANRTKSIGANRMLIGPPWVKRHSKPNPYASTWENDVIHYSVPVATFSSRFLVQRMPLIELSRLAQTGCKSVQHGSNGTRNQIPILQHGNMTSSHIRFRSRLFHQNFESNVCR